MSSSPSLCVALLSQIFASAGLITSILFTSFIYVYPAAASQPPPQTRYLTKRRVHHRPSSTFSTTTTDTLVDAGSAKGDSSSVAEKGKPEGDDTRHKNVRHVQSLAFFKLPARSRTLSLSVPRVFKLPFTQEPELKPGVMRTRTIHVDVVDPEPILNLVPAHIHTPSKAQAVLGVKPAAHPALCEGW